MGDTITERIDRLELAVSRLARAVDQLADKLEHDRSSPVDEPR